MHSLFRTRKNCSPIRALPLPSPRERYPVMEILFHNRPQMKPVRGKNPTERIIQNQRTYIGPNSRIRPLLDPATRSLARSCGGNKPGRDPRLASWAESADIHHTTSGTKHKPQTSYTLLTAKKHGHQKPWVAQPALSNQFQFLVDASFRHRKQIIHD